MAEAKRHFYHGTWTGNVPSITKKGLIPRTRTQCEEHIDAILAEYGETRNTVPEYWWHYPLERCHESVGKVYLTGDKDYAACNCLAGFEPETHLRAYLEAKRKHQKVVFNPPHTECSVCKVELSETEIPKEQMSDIDRRARDATRRDPQHFPTAKAAKEYILGATTITLVSVAPEKIICEDIGEREEYLKKCNVK